ncbi:ABC transporter, ATP-binding protein [Actinomyces graevenitzii F0530]|uniref:ABC transporter, ATP-binding protein n=1 Tax=Actinomyces graevenitzii F0530 TaxID=1321817 RepID=U1PQZ2_9ACTO|nr:ABC transporter ATP-binding protein/permease [Actinomyces graevenitzii]ERH18495.1 ABC transporter, ATP-binding protein [Actinomyces graevenitzii F0530]
MLELREISKSYVTSALTQVALDDVSVTFRDNEFVAILGASGSGKTTMLNVIGGLDHFDSGDLVIDGVSTAHYKDRDWDAYRNARVGFVFQSYNLIPHQSVVANVELALTLSGVSRGQRRRRALAALETVGLAEHSHKRPSQLSGGQMQRVAIARALINDPEIVLADEPTGALDSTTSVQVMDLLQEVARQRLVIMVTHNPELAHQYATRIVELADGRIISDSDPVVGELEDADGDDGDAEGAGDGAGDGGAKGAGRGAARAAREAAALNDDTAQLPIISAGEQGDGSAAESNGAAEGDGATENGGATEGDGANEGTGGAVGRKESQHRTSRRRTDRAAKRRGHNKNRVDVSRPGRRPRRVSMGPLTALGLSFTNLMTKKGRTAMTSFAGSIGIIGIALVLALASGANNYIITTQERAMASYPLTIERVGMDLTGVLSTSAAGEAAPNDGKIHTASQLSNVTASMKTNDLTSLQSYLKGNGGNINKYVRTIEYNYGINPRIYLPKSSKGPVQVNPDVTFAEGSTNFGAFQSMTSTNIFKQLANDRSLYVNSYDVVSGRWPTAANELVVALDSNGRLPERLEYTLGLRDYGQLQNAMAKLRQNEGVKLKNSAATWAPQQILGAKFKLVNVPDLYKYDAKYKVWSARDNDAAALKQIVAAGTDLKIVGIVKPTSSGGGFGQSSVLSPGIYYTGALTQQVIAKAAASPIVKQQLADPKRNVFTGKTFEEEAKEHANPQIDLSSLITIDQDKLMAAFKFDPSSINAGLNNLDFSGMDLSGAVGNVQLDLSSLDLSQMPAIDLNGLDASKLDYSTLQKQFPQLANIDLAKVVQAALANGAIKPGGAQALSNILTQVVGGFIPWYAQHGGDDDGGGPGAPGQADPAKIAAAVTKYLQTEQVQKLLAPIFSGDTIIDRAKLTANLTQALGNDPAVQQIAENVSADLASQISSKVASALSSTVTTALSKAVGQLLQSSLNQLMTTLQTQLTAQVQNAMGQIMGNLSSAMQVDANKLKDAFKFNMKPAEIAALLTQLLNPNATTARANLLTLGYARADQPERIDIYPKSFADKDHVKSILASYNAEAKAAKQTDKVIVYSDLVGMLMSSITNIINIVTALLVAFVSISLVVSSIMIGIITFISVLERRKEIGILRSIGASKADIRRVFNAETLIVGALAGLLGVGVSVLVTIPANIYVADRFGVQDIATLPVAAGVILVVISMGLTFLAGLLPASKAAREDPVEALRGE